MRIVTALILVSLFAAVYIAGSGPDEESSRDPSVAKIAPAATGDSEAASTEEGDELAGPPPGMFPEGLSGRSRDLVEGGTARSSDEMPDIFGSSDIVPDEDDDTSGEAIRAAREEIRSAGNPFVTPSPDDDASTTGAVDGEAASSGFEPIEVTPPAPLDLSGAKDVSEPVVKPGPPAQRTSFVGGDAGPADGESEPVSAQPDDGESEAAETDAAQDLEPVPVPTPVTRGGDLDGRLVDESGQGIEGATVSIVDADSAASLDECETDAEGRFTSTGLEAARVRLSVRADTVPLGIAAPVAGDVCRNGDEPRGFGATCVELESNEVAKAKIELPYSSGVQGTVKDPSGKLVEGALVRAVCRVEGFEAVQPVGETDEDGFFFLTLVPGPYELQVLVPGAGDPKKRSRRQDIEAEAGSALILEAIDLSKPVPKGTPERSASTSERAIEPSRARVVKSEPRRDTEPESHDPETRTPARIEIDVAKGSASVEAPVANSERVHPVEASGARPKTAEGRDDPPARRTPRPAPPKRKSDEEPSSEGATLTGRAISTWGESIDGLVIVCRNAAGAEIAKTSTRPDGRYDLTGLPAGPVVVHIAPDAPLGKRGPLGHIVRKRPEPIEVTLFEGQTKSRIEDVVVDVAPVFRLEGRIAVAPSVLDAYKKDLIADDPDMADLDDGRFLSAYLRHLELVQRNRGGQGRNRPVTIESDGSFTWQCNLPAEDVLFELHPRTTRGKFDHAGSVGVVVTPAGVRARELTIDYPPKPKPKKERKAKKTAKQ